MRQSFTRPVMSGGGASFNCRFFSTEISAIVYMGSAALMWLLAAWAGLAIYTLACDFAVGAPIIAGLCAIAAYIVGSDAVIRQIKSFKA